MNKMNMKYKKIVLALASAMLVFFSIGNALSEPSVPNNLSIISQQTSNTPRMPIGINLSYINYYSPGPPFNDVMTTASDMLSYPHGTYNWDSGLMDQIPVDANGWPLEIPYSVGGVLQDVRFLINSFYAGDYVVLHDGEGTITLGGVSSTVIGGVTHITLPGTETNIWINITSSTKGNHIRNMRIIPAVYKGAEETMPTFNSLYLQGLQPFHALRFMDWTHTNHSPSINWETRTTTKTYTQAGGEGVAWEYVIELANTLKADPWICIPHKVTDAYINSLAQLFLANLDSNLTLYVEFSNELWNWIYTQAGICIAALSGIGAAGTNHPEKDAYMMARTFTIFNNVWSVQRSRLVTVAAVQLGWVDNTRRILNYLFDVAGVGADAVSPGGYFYFDPKDHAIWNAMDPAKVTAEMVINSADGYINEETFRYIDATSAYARDRGIDYIVYEGGQHMQPYNQQDWGYNQAVWDAQIHSGMYDLYMRNLTKHKDVNCKLFMGYDYVRQRESRYGSWGHLEDLADINAVDLKSTAPKYKALLDFNTAK